MERPAFPGISIAAIVAAKNKQPKGLSIEDPPFAVSQQLARLIEHCTDPSLKNRPSASEAFDLLNSLKPTVSHPAVAAPVNMDFEISVADGSILGWLNSKGFVDSVSTDYEIGIAPHNKDSKTGCAVKTDQ